MKIQWWTNYPWHPGLTLKMNHSLVSRYFHTFKVRYRYRAICLDTLISIPSFDPALMPDLYCDDAVDLRLTRSSSSVVQHAKSISLINSVSGTWPTINKRIAYHTCEDEKVRKTTGAVYCNVNKHPLIFMRALLV